VDSVNVSGKKMPVVLFSNGIRMIIEPVWKQPEDYPCIGISQLPLCLAWALTIHKIQGATLAMAEMDLGDSIFEYGQTYVALSRIQSLDGLYLSAFKPMKIKANPKVKAFYKNIRSVSTTEEEEEEEQESYSGGGRQQPPAENTFKRFELREESYDSSGVKPDVKIVRL
jgi:hypothetical protein